MNKYNNKIINVSPTCKENNYESGGGKLIEKLPLCDRDRGYIV
jgi:hypothetical protein